MSIVPEVRERVAVNEIRIEDIRGRLDQLEVQIREAHTLLQLGTNQVLSNQATLNTISERLQKIEATKPPPLDGKDRAVIYTSLFTLIGLIVVEVLRVLA